MRRTGAVCAWLFLTLACAHGQTRTNPDFSVVGDFQWFGHNDGSRPDELDRVHFASPQLEFVVGGYLNPYSRADVTIGWHEGESAEIEEAYATFMRGLPLGTNLRVGQYLLEFGRLNPIHPHAYPFIARPLPHLEFFGEEGLRDLAIRGAWLLPTGSAYTEVMFAAVQGDLLAGHHHEEDHDAEVEPSFPVGYFGRLTSSLAVSENAELALGVSGLTAIHDADENLRAWTGGADLKYRWQPSRNRAFTLEGELLVNRRQVMSGGEISTFGAYAFVDYRFRQRYSVGLIGEYTEGALDPDETVSRAGLFLGFAPVEETSLVRLVGRWTEPEGQSGFWSVIAQLVFSLGPHQAHAF